MSIDIRLESFQQVVQQLGDDQTFEVITFPGADPIIVQRDQVLTIYTQNGDAIGFGAAFIPPAAPAGARFLGPPQTNCRLLEDGVRWQTTWSYVYVLPSPLTLAQRMTMSAAPTTPNFQEPTP